MMAGTFGYIAPEMHYTGKATKESDVYSFGNLVLEVVCGKTPVNLQVEDPDDDYMERKYFVNGIKIWNSHDIYYLQ